MHDIELNRAGRRNMKRIAVRKLRDRRGASSKDQKHSPWRRQDKVAYSYSPALRAWESAHQNNKPDQAAIHDRDWHRQFDALTGGSKKPSRAFDIAA